MTKYVITLRHGILLSFCIAIPAWYLGHLAPVVGAPVWGIVFGMLGAFWKRPSCYNAGISFTSKTLLKLSIVLLGFQMNLQQVFIVGAQSLLVMISTLSAVFLVAWKLGNFLRLNAKVTTLIGVGTAICGGSAIAVAAPAIAANDEEIAFSISVIFLFNVIAAFVFPLIGHVLQLSDLGFGMWAGTAVNDTSSVVAAGYSFSNAAGNYAVIVKLTRTLLILPVTLILALMSSGQGNQSANRSGISVFPVFILGFLLASIIYSTGIIPSALSYWLVQAGKFLIVMAMVSIGLNTQLAKLFANGVRPLVLGFACSVTIAFVSLLAQYWLGLL